MLGRSALITTIAVATSVAALVAVAQPGGRILTLRQVEQRFTGMSPVHIEKCDLNGDGLYDRAELACVSSIYDVMYRDD